MKSCHTIRDNEPPTLDAEKEFLSSCRNGFGGLVLVFDSSNLARVLEINRSPHYQESHRINLGASVKNSYRERGVGTREIGFAENWAKDNQIKSIELEVIVNNPAISLYKHLGFNNIGVVVDGVKVNGDYVGIHYMQKAP